MYCIKKVAVVKFKLFEFIKVITLAFSVLISKLNQDNTFLATLVVLGIRLLTRIKLLDHLQKVVHLKGVFASISVLSLALPLLVSSSTRYDIQSHSFWEEFCTYIYFTYQEIEGDSKFQKQNIPVIPDFSNLCIKSFL